MIRLLPREPGNDFVFIGPTLKRGLSTAARCVAHTSCSASSYEPAEAECGESEAPCASTHRGARDRGGCSNRNLE